MSFLLGPDEKWHHRPAHWGKGFLISGKESGRWDHPADIQISGEGIRCKYNVLDGVRLEVTRRFGERWTEEYVLKNERAKPLQIGSLAVSVPFRDVYHDAANSLTRACHAHVWTGGAASWLWALRMNGAAPGLGLALTKGELWSYSIESRNQFGSSHLRGHIYLHVTDAARAPHAMGGQPVIRVAPGADYKWSWTIKWHDNFAVFEREVVKPIVTVPSLTATLDGTITIVTRKQVTIKTPRGVKQRATAKGESVITSKHAGIQHIDIADGDRQSRVAVLFHPALRRVVERRIDFILKHQRAIEREPGRSGAFVPFDTQFGLRVNAAAWRDWSDGRERICMALLLQYARRLGWSDAGRLDAALADYDLFCKTHIVQPDGTVLEDSFDDSPERLYNYAWFAEFYMGQFDLYHRPDDALRAAAILENYYKRGGGKFLAFIDCMEAVIDTLGELGEKERADRLRANFLKHVDDFLVQGVDLPKHEVGYEQSIVAPLLLLLQAAQRIAPSSRYEKAFGRLLPWLNALPANSRTSGFGMCRSGIGMDTGLAASANGATRSPITGASCPRRCTQIVHAGPATKRCAIGRTPSSPRTWRTFTKTVQRPARFCFPVA